SFEISDTSPTSDQVFQEKTPSQATITQMEGTINEVCQVKGCWMKVALEDGNEVFVRFKDYAFFVPTHSKGKKVWMKGKAFVEEQSVEDLKHYAQDSGASAQEIESITEPERTLKFEASGVRIADLP
ncbi:MAG: DUF4920 domain-containing protein, partial [Bacteroidota bacterium]